MNFGALTVGLLEAHSPRLRPPTFEIADRGVVRIGSSCISANLPPVREPKAEITDRGVVRIGSSCISAKFPLWRHEHQGRHHNGISDG
jgi:hypothetical protein